MVCSNCKANVDIPKLRNLQQYADESSSTVSEKQTNTAGEQSRLKGLLFALGILITIFSSALGGYVFYTASQKYQPINFEEMMAREEEKIDALPPAMLYDAWTSRPTSLGNWQEYDYVKKNREAMVLRTIAYIIFSIGGIGLVMVLVSFCLK